MSKYVLFQTIQFSIGTLSSFIWSIDRTFSGATTPGQSEPGNDCNEEVFHIPQSCSITGTSPLDCFVSYPGHSWGESYPSAEKQSVYSTAPTDWAQKGACWVWHKTESYSEALVVDKWRKCNTPSLELLRLPLWPRVVVVVPVRSNGFQIIRLGPCAENLFRNNNTKM